LKIMCTTAAPTRAASSAAEKMQHVAERAHLAVEEVGAIVRERQEPAELLPRGRIDLAGAVHDRVEALQDRVALRVVPVEVIADGAADERKPGAQAALADDAEERALGLVQAGPRLLDPGAGVEEPRRLPEGVRLHRPPGHTQSLLGDVAIGARRGAALPEIVHVLAPLAERRDTPDARRVPNAVEAGVLGVERPVSRRGARRARLHAQGDAHSGSGTGRS
jgi:hypothetical protein